MNALGSATPAAPAACAHCTKTAGIDRRAFLSGATMAAVAALLAACSNSSATFFTGPAGGAISVKLTDFPVLANIGGLARVDNGVGAPTALVRTGASSFLGVTMVCTHKGATIDVTGTTFRCPNHGALFSGTGVWMPGGQVTSSLATYSAIFDGANTVTIARP